MKKTLTLLVLTSILSFTSYASVDKIIPGDDTFETAVCATAVNSGMEQAKSMVVNNGDSFIKFREIVKCNGMSISRFVKSHSSDKNKKVVKLVVDETNEAMLCAEAAALGINKAFSKHNIDLADRDIICNGMSIKDFSRKYRFSLVVISSL
jgi:hypothetical protein